MLTIFYGFVVVGVMALSFSIFTLAMEGCCCWRLPHPVTTQTRSYAVTQQRGQPVQKQYKVSTFQYRKEAENDLEEGSEAVCAVCLSSFEDKEYLQLLPNCDHAFHVSCIQMWLHSHHQCPLCRGSIDRLELESESLSIVGLLNAAV